MNFDILSTCNSNVGKNSSLEELRHLVGAPLAGFGAPRIQDDAAKTAIPFSGHLAHLEKWAWGLTLMGPGDFFKR